VPQVCVQEVMRQVAAPQKRFMQTGIEWEHRVDRSSVVVGTGQVEFGGRYDGPMRTYQGLVREVAPMATRGSVRTNTSIAIAEPVVSTMASVRTSSPIQRQPMSITEPVAGAMASARTSSPMRIISGGPPPLPTTYGMPVGMQHVGGYAFGGQLQTGQMGQIHTGQAVQQQQLGLFDMLDQNHDGVVTRQEFNQAMV